jgi:tRNA G26 N,N-dimethylase Trm1
VNLLRKLVVTIAMSLAANVICAAQTKCASRATAFQTNCSNQICSNSVYVVYPTDCFTNVCTQLYQTSVSCCGIYYTTYVAGGPCFVAELRDPAVQKQILALNQQTDLLVPTCDGSYVPANYLAMAQSSPPDASERFMSTTAEKGARE